MGGTMTRSEMMTYFEDHFGYTGKEVVALMGAHTLGLNTLDNSGYEGKYTNKPLALDNTYYSDMLSSSGLTWTNEETSEGKWQFTSEDDTTRLNTDLELVYDLTLDSDTAECTCTVGDDCDEASSYNLVKTYANNADTWATDFAAIMEKLMETGYDDDDLTNTPLKTHKQVPKTEWLRCIFCIFRSLFFLQYLSFPKHARSLCLKSNSYSIIHMPIINYSIHMPVTFY